MNNIELFLLHLMGWVGSYEMSPSEDGGKDVKIPTSIGCVTDLLNASDSGQESIMNGNDKKAMTYCKTYGAHIVLRRECMVLSFLLPNMDSYKVHIEGKRID